MPESSTENANANAGTEGTETDVNAGIKTTEGTENKKTTYTAEEYEALKARMVAADRNKTGEQRKAEELQAKLDAIEAEKLSEADKLKLKAEQAEASAKSHLAELNATRMQNAFLKVSDFVWVDTDDAFDLLTNRAKYADLIEKDDKGNVTSVLAAVKLLAKDKPHFLKPKDLGPASEATGSSANTSRKGDGKDADVARAALAAKYPALRK